MKKSLTLPLYTLFRCICLAICLVFIFSLTSCPQPESPGNPAQSGDSGNNQPSGSGSDNPPSEPPSIVGRWFFDYGYNQENAGIEEVTFNIDGTFLVRSAGGGYVTYEKGTYTVQDGSPKVLLLHITGSKDGSDGAWESIDVTNYYNIDDLTADELIMGRTKRDRSAMPDDNQIEYFDPPIYNHYYRMNSVTEDQLNGKWLPAGTGNQSFHSFSDDGVYMTTSVTGKYLKATYSLVQKETGTELHTIFYQFSDTITGPWNDIDSPPEYIYNIWLAGEERFILMQPTGSIIDGLTSVNDTEWYSIQYYDTELVTYTYHINVLGNDVTFTDRCPKGQAYTLPDAGKALYLAGVSESILNNIDILGYYTNQELSGNRVTSINATGNTSNRDFYVKFGLKCKKNAWYNDEENREDWNYETLLPADLVVRNLSQTQGNTRFIRVSGTLSDDIQTWGSVGIYADADNYWHEFASEWIPIHSENKKFYQIFEIPWDDQIPDDAYLRFRFTYSSDVGKPVIIEDYDIFMFDDSLSYDVMYYFGKMKLEPVTYCTEDTLTLPTDMMYFEWADWDIAHSLDFTGWYEDENYTTSITQIAANSVSACSTKDVYAKYIPKLSRYDHPGSVDDPYGWHTAFRAAAFTSELGNRLNTHQPVKVKITATVADGINLENVFNFYLGIIEVTSDAVPLAGVGWSFTVDGNKLTAEPEFTLEEQKTVRENDNELFLLLSYGKDTYDDEIQFTDFKLELVTD